MKGVLLMSNSKQVFFVLFLIFCLVFGTACSSSDNGDDVTINQNNVVNDIPEPDESHEQEEETSQISVEEQLLLDYEGIKITLKSLNMDGFFGPSLKVLVENDTENPVTVQIRDASVNDVMAETMFSCDVAPNKKANDEIVFSQSKLDIAGITSIKDIEFKFHVFHAETWDGIFDSDVINITTSASSSYVQTYNDEGLLVLDEKGFKIVMKRLDSTDSFWGAEVHVYIENNSESDVIIQARDVSINGFMVNPIFSCDILAGKKAYDSITFLEDELVDNDITSIDEMELSFHIFDISTWDTIFDSQIISLSFEKQ